MIKTKIEPHVSRAVVDRCASARFERDHIVTPQRVPLWLGLDVPHGTPVAEVATTTKHWTWVPAGSGLPRFAMPHAVFMAMHAAALAQTEGPELVLDPDAPADAPAVMLPVVVKPAEKKPTVPAAPMPEHVEPEPREEAPTHPET